MVEQHNEIINEKNKHSSIQQNFLESILPEQIVGRVKDMQAEENYMTLKKSMRSISQSHKGVGILYADLVGFTAFSSRVDPFKVMSFLNDLFNVFDGLCDHHNVYKLETIGDCYVATVGLVTGNTVSAQLYDTDLNLRASMLRSRSVANGGDIVGFAKAMLVGSRQVLKPEVNTPAIMRIGIHTVSKIIYQFRERICVLISCSNFRAFALHCEFNSGLLH